MRYTDPELMDRLAAEYVLGTLQGRAQRRFQRLLISEPALAQRVVAWQEWLGPMVELLPPERPHPRVWRGIYRRIGPPGKRTGRRRIAPAIAALFGGIGGAAIAAILAFVLLLPKQPTDYEYLGVLAGENDQPAWSVAIDLDTDALRARVIAAPQIDSDQAVELWLMPPVAGDAPQSLGLLPEQGERRFASQVARLAKQAPETAALAISVEPAGGSPTGQPTGPVIVTGRIVRL